MKKSSLTVIFLTLNEEYHIGEAIDNVKDIAEEIFIVDSLSSDHTIDIALEKGAKVVQRPFTNFGDQWNYALEHLPIKTDWTMKMDPDERLSDELKKEIIECLDKATSNAFQFYRILFFMGKPLRHCRNLVLRIWPTGDCHFSDVQVNEHPITSAHVITLNGEMYHFDSRDLHHWLDKQNYYTSMEALSRFRGNSLSFQPKLFGTSSERRMFFKKIFFFIPFRYFFLFIFLLLNGAWMSGLTGIRWAQCRILVMKLRELKYKEMRIKNHELYLPQRGLGLFDKRVSDSPLQKVFYHSSSSI